MMLIAGAGGFLGTCGRFLINRWATCAFQGGLPMGTFIVNVIGCFLVGALFGLMERGNMLSATQSLLFITGFCGGFTTFSTFANEMWMMVSKGDWGTFTLYLAASILCGILAVWSGRALFR